MSLSLRTTYAVNEALRLRATAHAEELQQFKESECERLVQMIEALNLQNLNAQQELQANHQQMTDDIEKASAERQQHIIELQTTIHELEAASNTQLEILSVITNQLKDQQFTQASLVFTSRQWELRFQDLKQREVAMALDPYANTMNVEAEKGFEGNTCEDVLIQTSYRLEANGVKTALRDEITKKPNEPRPTTRSNTRGRARN